MVMLFHASQAAHQGAPHAGRTVFVAPKNVLLNTWDELRVWGSKFAVVPPTATSQLIRLVRPVVALFARCTCVHTGLGPAVAPLHPPPLAHHAAPPSFCGS